MNEGPCEMPDPLAMGQEMLDPIRRSWAIHRSIREAPPKPGVVHESGGQPSWLPASWSTGVLQGFQVDLLRADHHFEARCWYVEAPEVDVLAFQVCVESHL